MRKRAAPNPNRPVDAGPIAGRRSGSYVVVRAVRLFERVRAHWVAIDDVVGISWGDSARNIIEPSKMAHTVRNRIIGAGRIAAE